ncbi:ABC-type transport system involved in cytochrome c biogenesis permease subunit [Desulfobaculum xiamenense]|uniref:ABC-type transport system involved in cytochrome c biogenesis permease subunit n=1 Tax=Desulfobaculum xiamenense TaxID=995050 RepID=A0A846QEI9_9BACT|nr:cytochrome c biogenesis protein CcsA [Desulfobaculum xiamenense]NJB66778.1 ABC-type transport system involved in cytochrome c biogenesis permease subunit [Desulfobaculum xiamenense]
MELYDVLQIGITVLYTFGAVLFIGGMLGMRPGLKTAAGLSSGAGFALHTLSLALYFKLMGYGSFLEGDFHLSLLGWVLLAIFFALWWRLKLDFLALAASPLALLLYLSSMSVPGTKVLMPKALAGSFFMLHIGSLFFSLAFLAMAFAAGALFMHLERKIKTKEKLVGFRKDLPSLNTFDHANHLAVVFGFPLYTVGLLSGFIWARFAWGRIVTGDPKEIVSLAIWVVYAYLFHQRLAMGWRGRKAAMLAMAVFAFCVFSLVVVNFMVPSHHNFMQ